MTNNESSTKKIVFLDDSEESETETDFLSMVNHNEIKKKIVKPIIGDRNFYDYLVIDAKKYDFKTWPECFPDNKVCLRKLVFRSSWEDFFNKIDGEKWYEKLESNLSNILVKGEKIVPYAELVFNPFNVLPFNKIKVVIIGQDPYPTVFKHKNRYIPDACGNCFSAPKNSPSSMPKSLINIYKNLKKFNHIRTIPNSSLLTPWVLQGCLMINSALTTIGGKRGSHEKIWKDFTNELINYINENCNHLVFLVWGRDANFVCKNVNPDKHLILTSSHPSPLSCHKTCFGLDYGFFKNESNRKNIVYPPFEDVDHFGEINSYLKSVGITEIFWDCII